MGMAPADRLRTTPRAFSEPPTTTAGVGSCASFWLRKLIIFLCSLAAGIPRQTARVTYALRDVAPSRKPPSADSIFRSGGRNEPPGPGAWDLTVARILAGFGCSLRSIV